MSHFNQILKTFLSPNWFLLPLYLAVGKRILLSIGTWVEELSLFAYQKGDAEKPAQWGTVSWTPPSDVSLVTGYRLGLPSCHGCESSSVFMDPDSPQKLIVGKFVKVPFFCHFLLYHLSPFHQVPVKLIRMHPRMISQNGTEVKLQRGFWPRCLPVWGQSL